MKLSDRGKGKREGILIATLKSQRTEIVLEDCRFKLLCAILSGHSYYGIQYEKQVT